MNSDILSNFKPLPSQNGEQIFNLSAYRTFQHGLQLKQKKYNHSRVRIVVDQVAHLRDAEELTCVPYGMVMNSLVSRNWEAGLSRFFRLCWLFPAENTPASVTNLSVRDQWLQTLWIDGCLNSSTFFTTIVVRTTCGSDLHTIAVSWSRASIVNKSVKEDWLLKW